MASVFLTGVGRLVTNVGEPIADAVVAIEDSLITYAGPATDAPHQTGDRIDCEGRAIIPGFVDAHTHLVFAGDRSEEFAERLAGRSYSDIAAEGGGILATVGATRAAGADQLFSLAAARLWRMIRAGTTTVEIKSGYGLDTATEVRLLEVARRLGEELPVTVKTTFLGAHSIPVEYRQDRQGYVELVIEEMLPAVVGLADYCDVFVEDGAFTVDEARRIFTAAASHGMGARVYAEQLGAGGGAALAAEISAVSADHLDHVTLDDARALAAAGVTAVLVPGASHTLGSAPAPARMLAEAGATIALATDCNPGTSYFESMAPIISLAVVQMGMGVGEAVAAATLGGARALELDERGGIGVGMPADLVILDAPSETHLPYRPGTNLVWRTIKEGVAVG